MDYIPKFLERPVYLTISFFDSIKNFALSRKVFNSFKKNNYKFTINKGYIGDRYTEDSEFFTDKEIDLSEFLSSPFYGYIVNFAKVLKEKFPEEDLQNFYRNLRTIKVFNSNMFSENLFVSSKSDTKILGIYSAKRNSVKINMDYIDRSIYHEFFHLASSRYENGVTYSGFSQENGKDMVIGTALTEGYTELLNKRYFHDENYKCSYFMEVCTASFIEKIVGKEKMESLYLNANLPGLIDELSKYSSIEDVERFIKNSDMLFIRGVPPETNQEMFNFNTKFMVTSYLNKIISEGKDMDEESVKQEILNTLNELVNSVQSNGVDYKVDVASIVNEYYIEYLNKKNEEPHK